MPTAPNVGIKRPHCVVDGAAKAMFTKTSSAYGMAPRVIDLNRKHGRTNASMRAQPPHRHVHARANDTDNLRSHNRHERKQCIQRRKARVYELRVRDDRGLEVLRSIEGAKDEKETARPAKRGCTPSRDTSSSYGDRGDQLSGSQRKDMSSVTRFFPGGHSRRRSGSSRTMPRRIVVGDNLVHRCAASLRLKACKLWNFCRDS